MKTTSSRLAALAFGLLASSQICLARIWVDSTGRHKTEAEFVNVIDGNVILKASDGRIITLPLDKLSAADRAHAQKLDDARPEAVPSVPEKNVEEPQLDKGGSDLEVKAEAKLRPGASFQNGKTVRYVSLKVEVHALGGVAADAFAIGPVKAEPVTINGKAHELEEGFGESGFDVIDRSKKGIFAKHPKGGVTAEIDFGKVPDDIAKFGPLKGSFQVLAGGTEKLVDVTDLLKRSKAKIKDPALESAGISVKFIRSDQGDDINIGVEVEGENADSFVGVELVDSQGEEVKSASSSMRANGMKQFNKYASEEALEDAVLKLRFRDGAKKVEIPFNLTEVEVGE